MTTRAKISLADRFWRYVDRLSTSECWNWKASFVHNGYGKINNGLGVIVRAHRVSWELAYGAVPSGMLVLHRCDNRACVNPEHLFLGTPKENSADMMRKGRWTRPKMPSGENHHAAAFPDSEISRIRLDDRPAREIAKEFGCHPVTIRKARKGEGRFAAFPRYVQCS